MPLTRKVLPALQLHSKFLDFKDTKDLNLISFSILFSLML